MAGTRGLAMFRGEQVNAGVMRNRHFDVNNKIGEQFIGIDFNNHREILEDTKIDVFSQVNNKVVASLTELDITADLGGKPQATPSTEGVVTGNRVDFRATGSEDFPFIDSDGDRVYGRIDFVGSPDGGVTPDKFVLKFFSEQVGAETPYTFAVDAQHMDFRYTLRTNMSVIPIDAIVNGGSGFVEGATDANAYMNLTQLMKDVYGGTGTLDNDGNANLVKSVVQQIADLINDLAANVDGKGSNLVGVEVDTDGNYVGTTVQAVLTELAAKVTANQTGLANRVTKLETENEEEVYEATGGETQYNLVNGIARPKTVILAINGQIQAPGINFTYLLDGSSNITGFNFSPNTLTVTGGVPDVLFIQYKKVL